MRFRFGTVAMPFVILGVYAWVLKQAVGEMKDRVARAWWPGPPIDHP